MNHFANKNLNIIKWLVFCISLIYIFFRIGFNQEVSNITAAIGNAGFNSVFYILAVFALMLVNWFLEAIKWKVATGHIQKISFKRAVAAVFAGISFSVIMPNRAGEFAGKIFLLDKTNRVKGFFASLVTGYSQLIITILTGNIALIYAYYFFYGQVYSVIPVFLILPSIALALLSALCYFRLKWLAALLSLFKFFKKYSGDIQTLKEYGPNKLVFFVAAGLLRYVVFSGQFYLLLHFFGSTATVTENLSAIMLTYYFMSVLPVFAVTELIVRGSVALFCFGFFMEGLTGIVTASTLLWIINIAIPALAGNYFVARFRIWQK